MKNRPAVETLIRTFLAPAIFAAMLGTSGAQSGNVTISGTVTDFEGHALDGVTIRLKDRTFANLYETVSGKDGRYSLSVSRGTYYCLYAIRLSEYRESRLEYWAWNVPAYEDLVIDPKYDRMEIYGVSIFEPTVTPQETYMVYFRPMSLARTKELVGKKEIGQTAFVKAGRVEKTLKLKEGEVLDIGPDTIDPGELTIRVNGTGAEVLGLSKTLEYARGQYYVAYLAQIRKPEAKGGPAPAYDRITIILRSARTGETGMADGFIKRP